MRFRYRLRSLLLAAIICCGGLAWYSAHARQHEAELRALNALNDSGSLGPDSDICMVSAALFTGHVGIRSVAPERLHPAMDYVGCTIFDRVVRLSLRGSDWDDRSVEYLTTFTSLQELHLTHTRISRNGLQRLRNGLPYAQITYSDRRDINQRVLRDSGG